MVDYGIEDVLDYPDVVDYINIEISKMPLILR